MHFTFPVHEKTLKILLQLALIIFPSFISGQPAVLDTTFKTGTGANLGINELIIQPDDKVIVAGMFASFNGTTAGRIIRLLPDGQTDSTWVTAGGGANFDIRGSALQADGKVLIGGIFTTYNGVTANRLIRLDSIGNIDPSFAVGVGPNNEVQGITVNNNRVVIHGFFSQYQGTPVPSFGVLQMNGTLDTSFTMPSESFLLINDFHILSNDQLYLVGNFPTYNGQTVNRIVRLNPNGSIDTSFNTGSGLNALASRLQVQDNGDIFIAGSFSTYKGSPVSRVIRLHPNGDRDTSFNAVVPNLSTISALAIDTVGRVYIAGSDAGMLFLKRLLPDGSEDISFNTGIGFNGNITQLAHQSNHKLLVTGTFSLYQNQQAGRVARLYTDPSIITNSENVFTKENVTVYPNPSTDKIYINIKNAGTGEIKVCNINGKQVYKSKFLASEIITINTTDWFPGIYFLELLNDKGDHSVVKMIKM